MFDTKYLILSEIKRDFRIVQVLYVNRMPSVRYNQFDILVGCGRALGFWSRPRKRLQTISEQHYFFAR